MKISTHVVSVPLHTPFVTALRTATHAESLLVEISDGSVSGWGEAPQVWKVTGESLAGAQACVEGPIASALAGLQPDDLTESLRRVQGAVHANHGAKAAVDVALHDLAARRHGQTLHGFLGSTVSTVRTDVTLSAGDPASLAAAGVARVADGFDVLKVKVGTGNAVDDVDRVRRIRDAVVGVGAAAALVAAYPTTAVNDLDAAWWLKEAPVVGGIRYEGSLIHLPSAAGLGVTGLRA